MQAASVHERGYNGNKQLKMSQLTKTLSEEHQNILKVIDALEKEANELQRGKELDKTFLRKAVDFIKNYADKFHHMKEEDILFKELCADSNKENMRCNPVHQMLHEHDLGREHVKGIVEGLEESDKEKVIEHLWGYCSLLKEHIFKEDNILYPMADQVLSEEIMKKLHKESNKVENDRKKDKIKYLAFVKAIGKRT